MVSFDSLRRYTDASTGKTILEVDELDFLKNPKHRYGWIKRHFLNIWLKWALGNSDIIIPVKVSLPKEAGNEYINTNCTFSYTIECVQGNADPSEVTNP